MTSFHFDLGDSNDGPIGFCARVQADSQEQALERLREALPDDLVVPTSHEGIEYIEVYFNRANINLEHIDDEEDVDDDEVEIVNEAD